MDIVVHTCGTCGSPIDVGPGPGPGGLGPDLTDLVLRLRHHYATAVGPPVIAQVPVTAGRAQLVLGPNPARLYAAVQLPPGMIAYEGRDSGVTDTTGYRYPIGGGWVYGAEDTYGVWLYCMAPGIVTVKEVIGDVAYP